jgi:hypothetical protein
MKSFVPTPNRNILPCMVPSRGVEVYNASMILLIEFIIKSSLLNSSLLPIDNTVFEEFVFNETPEIKLEVKRLNY